MVNVTVPYIAYMDPMGYHMVSWKKCEKPDFLFGSICENFDGGLFKSPWCVSNSDENLIL